MALWVAPLLLGQRSTSFPHLYPYAPHWEDDLSCHVLDPRYPQVRDHVADLCLRLVRDYNVEMLKIDFLDQAMAYRGQPLWRRHRRRRRSNVGDARTRPHPPGRRRPV